MGSRGLWKQSQGDLGEAGAILAERKKEAARQQEAEQGVWGTGREQVRVCVFVCVCVCVCVWKWERHPDWEEA